MSRVLHIIALTAFLSGIIAPACGFAWGGKYSVIEICTDQGIENRIVANTEQPDSPNPQHERMSEQCQFCFANTHITALSPTILSMIEGYNHSLSYQHTQYEAIRLSRLTSHEQPRGPPSLA